MWWNEEQDILTIIGGAEALKPQAKRAALRRKVFLGQPARHSRQCRESGRRQLVQVFAINDAGLRPQHHSKRTLTFTSDGTGRA